MAHRRDGYGPGGGGRHRWVSEPATGPVLMGRRHDDDQDGVPNYLDPDSPEYEGVVERDELGGSLVARGAVRGAAGGLDAVTLREAMGASLPLARYQQLLPAFTLALAQAGCTTVNRAAMFCAQIGHESVGLKYARELWGPSAQQKRYEPGTSLAKQLGNTRPGDGYRYRGAGWIQTTGRSNFAAVSKWAHARGYVPSPTYFVDRPDELGSDRYVWVGPVWYWTVARPTLSAQAEAGALETCTRLINGGLTGIDDRRDRWNHSLRLGARLLPGASPAPAPPRPKGIPKMIERPLPPGNSSGRLCTPTGDASAIVARAWASVTVDGGARVELWAQRANPGADTPTGAAKKELAERDWTLHRGDRAWFELPSGTEYLTYRVTGASGPGSLLVEQTSK